MVALSRDGNTEQKSPTGDKTEIRDSSMGMGTAQRE